MEKTPIQGGATLWARQTIESEIFYSKPAEWFKIWFYLVNRVSHKDTKRYKRGEAFLQYDAICDATGASLNQVKKCLMWLRESGMIRTRRSTRGTNLLLPMYSHYQTLDNYYCEIKEPHKEPEKNQRRTREEPRYNKNVIIKEEDTLAFASLPLEALRSNTEDKPKSYKEFRDARREESGRPPMTPRKPTEKQAEVRDAFKAIDYFKQKGQTDHGMMFLEVSSEKRNAIVRKLVIAAQKINGDLTPLIDWWFSGEGEWAAYEPEQCFSAKTVERFKNTKNLISKKAKRNFWE